jgi:internalin A
MRLYSIKCRRETATGGRGFTMCYYFAVGVMGLIAAVCVGCGGAETSNTESIEQTSSSEDSGEETIDVPTPAPDPVVEERHTLTPAELRQRLKANRNAAFNMAGGEIREVGLADSGVTDIAPLKGLSLRILDMHGLPVSDISVLEGMPLKLLALSETPVSDISVLKGMPLEELYLMNSKVVDLSPLSDSKIKRLNLLGTEIEDISPVAKMPLHTLWLNDSKVSDLSPLEGKSLESLDLSGTPVDDLSALAHMGTLKRLNIAGSNVKDLIPLKQLRLERLIFTPKNFDKASLDVIRNMPSLQELDIIFPRPQKRPPLKPAQFWQLYDAGMLPE